MSNLKSRYVALLRGLVRAALENRESLEALQQALIQVASEIERLKSRG